MREMKDSGLKWIGKIPSSWNVMPNKYLMKKKKVICPVWVMVTASLQELEIRHLKINETFNTLIERIKELNKEIAQDKALGKGFCIGHSYFCNANDCAEEWMKDVVDFDILPMLSEYWFDESSKLQRWENILHGVFQ